MMKFFGKKEKTQTETPQSNSVVAELASVHRGKTIQKPAWNVRFDRELIGDTAGKIWHLLNEKGLVSFSELTGQIDDPQLVLQAIGWLSREGKLEFVDGEGGQKICLKSEESIKVA